MVEETVANDDYAYEESVSEMLNHDRNRSGSLAAGWPAILLTIGMISSALYAFSPRPHPPVPATQVKAGELMTQGLAEQDGRFIAVGELGRILYADSANGPWKEASIENNRGSNLTRVKFIGKNTALAVGHSGWLLRTEDGGESWTEVQFKQDNADPLLGIGGPFTGAASNKLFAFGAFGQYLVSTNGGRTFHAEEINVLEAEGEEAETSAADAEVDDIFGMGDAEDDPFGGGEDDYDPFADFESGGMAADFGSRHMYAMTQAHDGSLFLVGERGMILRSTDGGASWMPGKEIYTGSFYGIANMPDKSLLVFGMRGNAFTSSDLGESWQQSQVPLVQGLYDSAVASDGKVVVVGGSNTVLVSRDNGRSFIKTTRRGPDAYASVLYLGNNSWLLAGEGGVGKKSQFRSAGDAS